MISCNYVIAGVVKIHLIPTHFSPLNSPPVSTRPFGDTVVSIVACSKNFKAWACSSPAMRGEHRSHNIDGVSWLKNEIFSLFIPSLLLSRAFPYLTICRHVPPFQINDYRWFRQSIIQEFQLSNSSLPLQRLSPRVEDLLTPVPRKWMVHMNCGPPTFGSYCSIPSLSFIVISPRVGHCFPHIPPSWMALMDFRTPRFDCSQIFTNTNI
jgi:hypothetical protein